MLVIVHLLGSYVADLFKSRRRLEVENLFLRHQLNIALRRAPQRLRLRGSERALLVWMTRLWQCLLGLALSRLDVNRFIILSYVLLARMPSNASMPDFAVGIRLETVLWERLWERYGNERTDRASSC
jgi:hypothetical protein